ncbi:MAG: TatD family hydrolase [bacterium]
MDRRGSLPPDPELNYPLFDTHAHLYSKYYGDKLPELLEQINKTRLQVLVPGVDKKSSREALQLARENSTLSCAVGIHPHNARLLTPEELNWFKNKLKRPEVVALGELGLDYYYENSSRDSQKKMLSQFLELARSTATPVILHMRPQKNSSSKDKCRVVFKDLFEILDSAGGRKLTGIFHCFSGNLQEFKISKQYGFFYSAAGNILFPQNHELRNIFGRIPVDRLLIETDSPYMTPPPERGNKNNPFKVQQALKQLSSIYDQSEKIMADKTYTNACRILGINKSLEQNNGHC